MGQNNRIGDRLRVTRVLTHDLVYNFHPEEIRPVFGFNLYPMVLVMVHRSGKQPWCRIVELEGAPITRLFGQISDRFGESELSGRRKGLPVITASSLAVQASDQYGKCYVTGCGSTLMNGAGQTKIYSSSSFVPNGNHFISDQDLVGRPFNLQEIPPYLLAQGANAAKRIQRAWSTD